MRWGKCDVCVLVYQDYNPKFVAYCAACDAWICDRCRNDPVARALAAIKRHLGGARADTGLRSG